MTPHIPDLVHVYIYMTPTFLTWYMYFNKMWCCYIVSMYLSVYNSWQ